MGKRAHKKGPPVGKEISRCGGNNKDERWGVVIVIFGGHSTTCGDPSLKVDVYDVQNDIIIPKKDMQCHAWAAALTAVAASNGTIYTLGGYFGGPRRQVQGYNLETDTWWPETDLVVARFSHMSTVASSEAHGERIFVIGGAAGPNKVFADVEAATVSWPHNISWMSLLARSGKVPSDGSIAQGALLSFLLSRLLVAL